ncbi:hypothetical protein [Actinocorallia longicatena]|uniref:DNA-directed RNA polymerase specialized sigma24 family protein n=1 Tax=Actinocorallia longicatena TaxID=111803 RepID=A0ABP6QC55_9ACTN
MFDDVRFAASEARLFATLYDDHYPEVHRAAAGLAGSDFAERIASEVFRIAWSGPGSPPEHPLPWLLGVLGGFVRAEFAPSERRALLRADRDAPEGLAELPDAHRELLVLVVRPGLPPKSGAAVLGRSRAAARLLSARARRNPDFARLAAHPPPLPGPQDDRARRDLDRILSGPPALRPRPRRARAVVSGLLAAAVTAAVVVAVVRSDPPGPALPPPKRPAVDVDAVIAATARLPEERGAFWYERYVVAYGGTHDGFDFAEGSSEQVLWSSDRRRGISTRSLAALPLTVSDVAVWKRAGAPTAIPVKSDGLHLEKMRTGAWRDLSRKRSCGACFSVGTRKLARPQIAGLPADPDALAKRFFEDWLYTPAARFDRALTMLNDPVTPRVRAALIELARSQPGAYEVAGTTDPFGRPGTALVMEEGGPADLRIRHESFLDPATGRLLATRSTVVRRQRKPGSRPVGSLIGVTASVFSGWVDELPAALPVEPPLTWKGEGPILAGP